VEDVDDVADGEADTPSVDPTADAAERNWSAVDTRTRPHSRFTVSANSLGYPQYYDEHYAVLESALPAPRPLSLMGG
jgi:hypothetical protein